MEKRYYKELIEKIKQKKITKNQIASIKRELSKKYNLSCFPTDIQVFLNAKKEDIKYLKALQTKPTRSLSGVAVVAVMTKPIKCPHGKCAMCPGGPGSAFGEIPQSYTGKEPATMRALRAGFDPYIQVFSRLEQYIVTGHVPDKVELIIMGGTFPSFPKHYQEEFVKYSLKAMNDFSGLFFGRSGLDIMRFKEFFELPGDINDKKRAESIKKKILSIKNIDLRMIPSSERKSLGGVVGDGGRAYKIKESKIVLEKQQKENETARIRCIGMTIETRPDYAKKEHADDMLRLGCTRVELGVQSVYDDLLENVERGHTVQQSIDATKTLKDLGFKINYHYMLGLPGSNEMKDLVGLQRLFIDPRFRPDMLKIYPCMVVKGTKLHERWKKGLFKPLTTAEAAEIITEFKKKVPEYVRIMRVQRDIATYATEAGVDRTNLRQMIQEEMKKKGICCRCIRCREIGRLASKGKDQRMQIKEIIYDASDGKEFFIQAVVGDSDSLLGFCRMRFPSQNLRKEITKDSSLIRELHVYGETAGIGEKVNDAAGKTQHKGIGKALLKKAEQIAKKNGKKKIVVISGIGAREYYKKLGYKLEGVYMVKERNNS